jgi:hypothetical protein
LESRLSDLDAKFTARVSPTSQPVVVDTVLVQVGHTARADAYVVNIDDIDQVRTSYVPGQEYWTVDSLRSPVMEFFGCHFDGSRIIRGRLYYNVGFYDDTGSWVEKSASFVKWAGRIVRVARSVCEYDKDLQALIGRHAREWQRDGKGSFIEAVVAREERTE